MPSAAIKHPLTPDRSRDTLQVEGALEMTYFQFDEKKATQVAARLLEKGGGSVNYLLLMKMMYTIDRIALANWGQPVVGGDYAALPKGPVISPVLDLIKGDRRASSRSWGACFRTRGYELELKSAPGHDELSQAEIDLIDTVFVMLGHRDKWDVVQWTHAEFKEWKDPGKSSKAISIEDILRAVGKSEEEIEKISHEASYQVSLQSILGR